MARGIFRFAVIGVLIGLGACANVSTDPNEGGLFGGVKGLGTGEYDRRLDDRRDALAQEEDEEDYLRDEAEELNRKRRISEAKRSEYRTKISALERENRELEAELNAVKVETEEMRRKKVSLLAQLDSLKAEHARLKQLMEQDALTEKEMQDELRRLESEREDILRELEILLGVS